MGNADLGDFICLNHGRSALPYVHPQTSSHLQAYSQHHESKPLTKSTFPLQCGSQILYWGDHCLLVHWCHQLKDIHW